MRESSSASCWVCFPLLKPKNRFSTRSMLGSMPGFTPKPMPLPMSTISRPCSSEAMMMLLFSCFVIFNAPFPLPAGFGK